MYLTYIQFTLPFLLVDLDPLLVQQELQKWELHEEELQVQVVGL